MDEDPIVTAAWSRVLEHWDHKPSHDRFVSVCHERGMLGHAASKYKAVAEGLVVPEGDASPRDDLAPARPDGCASPSASSPPWPSPGSPGR